MFNCVNSCAQTGSFVSLLLPLVVDSTIGSRELGSAINSRSSKKKKGKVVFCRPIARARSGSRIEIEKLRGFEFRNCLRWSNHRRSLFVDQAESTSKHASILGYCYGQTSLRLIYRFNWNRIPLKTFYRRLKCRVYQRGHYIRSSRVTSI